MTKSHRLPTGIATAALFLAAGGPGVTADAGAAAAKLIKGKDIKGSAITSKHVKDGSLTVRDFASGSCRPPRARSAGERGPKGAPGVSGYEVVHSSVNARAEFQSATATCPSGKKVLGGGHFTSTSCYGEDLEVNYSNPLSGRDGWVVKAKFEGSASWTLTTYAICANVQ